MQSFESVACHIELVILSGMLELLSMPNQVLLNILVFQQDSLDVLQDLRFHQVMGIRLQKPVIYWDFSNFQNNNSWPMP